jgi:hypothetical protein
VQGAAHAPEWQVWSGDQCQGQLQGAQDTMTGRAALMVTARHRVVNQQRCYEFSGSTRRLVGFGSERALEAVRDGLRLGRRHQLPRRQRPRHICCVVPACAINKTFQHSSNSLTVIAAHITLGLHMSCDTRPLSTSQHTLICQLWSTFAQRCALTCWLCADDADVREQPLRCDGDARDHAAARDRHNDCVQPSCPKLTHLLHI